MKIIRNINDINIESSTAIALGKFDGIHLGHRQLINEILKQKKAGLLSMIITFEPSPEVFFGKSDNKRLLLNNEMEGILARLGIDILIYFPMNQATSKLKPESFVTDYLIKKFRMAFICSGEDLRFGDAGRGNCEIIKTMAHKLSFQALIIKKLCINEREISSTYAREAIEKGDIPLAAKVLGFDYPISGIVEAGAQLGRTLGFPTANLIPHKNKILPPRGVYFSKIITSKGEYNGISNIGVKPTIAGKRQPAIESYIFNFSGDLYQQEITVSLLKHHRTEQKFINISALKSQVDADIKAGQDYFLTFREHSL